MIQPYTEQWYNARRGKVTASRAKDVMVKGRGKDQLYGKVFYEYANELALEKMLGISYDDITTFAMEYGIETEPQVRMAYAEMNNVAVTEPGFITHPDNKEIGCTPDGAVYRDGIIEIKCPQVKAHWSHLRDGVPEHYRLQIQFQLMVTRAKWCDFISYNEQFPDQYQFYTERIEPDTTLMQNMFIRCLELIAVRDAVIENFKNKFK